MLGLFLILPVFALYAEHLQGTTPVLIGVAIGIYGLTQAFLQIPFGMLSDRIGRRPVIIGGLLVFALGSVVAASADTIWGVVAGRALQGSGAIAAAIMALAADLTRESRRTRAMAVIGMSIGMAFAVALVLGPVLDHWVGVPGIFWITAALALGGVLVVVFVVPTPVHSSFHQDAEPVPGQFGRVLRNLDLLRIDWGIFTLHMVLTSVFLAFPLLLRDLGLETVNHWKVYLPVLVLAIAVMVPFVIIAETRHKMKQVFIGGIAVLTVAQLGFFFFTANLVGLVVALFLFFTAFNLLEATLPSIVSKVAPVDAKGTAMGVYSSSQFVGTFLGGLLGGWVQQQFGTAEVFLFALIMLLFWLATAWGMTPPRQLSTRLLPVGEVIDEKKGDVANRVAAVAGVEEVIIVQSEGVAYL
ncbi:MAG TPA: MFS transporter, partial [Chromatiales bacterium]|nr:MFS transporter [Chromatiales bacterium]